MREVISMKMDFILSETDNGAMKEALSLVAKIAPNSRENFIVVVPETKTLFAERFLLDEIKNHAFTNIYIYSFNRLLKKIQTVKKLPLSKQGGVMIVRNIIMKNQDNLVCYKKTAKTAGFAESVYDTIQQLKSSGVSPEEIFEAGNKLTSALKIKLADISLIYREYENYIGENMIDLNDRLEMLEKEAENSLFIKNSHMFVVGFDSLTANMVSCIKNFVKTAKSVTVSASFLHPDRKNSHISENEVYSHFKKIADDFHIAYVPKIKGLHLQKDFETLKNNLYSYPLVSSPLHGGVEMFGSPSMQEECKIVASKIKQSVLKGKRRYGEIYCFLANPDEETFLTEKLDDFGVPYFVSMPYQEESHQFYLFIKSIFAIAKKNLDSEEVIKFARNNLLFFDSEKVDDFENYVLKFGTSYTKFLKPFEYGKDNLSRLENAEEIRQKIVDVFYDFVENISGKQKTSEIVDALLNFFDAFKMQDKLEQLSAVQESLGETRESLATKQVFEKATEVLQMLSQFLGEQNMSLDEFYTLLVSGLEADDISLLPLGVDQVQIVRAPDSIYNAKDLYILGATDGNFPKRELDLGLISDGEIVSLEGINQKKIEPTIRSINRRERFKMYQLVLVPEHLCISFADHLSNGEESKMSSLVNMIASLFTVDGKEYEIPKIYNAFDTSSHDFKDLLFSLGSKENAIRFLAESIAKYRSGANISLDIISKLYYLLENDLDENLKKQIEQINFEKEYETLQNADKLFFKNGTTSISELESYFSCPFKHFVNYGLRLKERELSSMKALDVGDILHAVAEQFMNFAVKNPNIKVEQFAKNTLRKVLANEKYSEEDNIILIKILEKEVVRLCKALYDEMQSSAFKTICTEEWFGGKNGKFSGIELCKNPKVEIVGKIDRIDKTILENGEQYYRIIDYKTGKIEANPADIYYGKKLQLAVYLDAIKDDKMKPSGVLYFPIHNDYADSKDKIDDAYRCKGFILKDTDVVLKMDKTLGLENPKSKYIGVEISTKKENLKSGTIELKNSSSLVSEDEIESISSYAIELSKKAVQEILQGYIKPTPFKKSSEVACEYCPFANVCGIAKKADVYTREATIDNIKDFYKGGNSWEK